MKRPIVWLSIHVILFLIFIFFREQFVCYYPNYYYPITALIIIFGVIIWFLAKKEIGRISLFITNEKIVTSGIYSKIRHPLYLGVKIIFFGLALMFKSITGAVLVIIILIPFHVSRSRLEEKTLIKKYGKTYINYKKKTWF